MVPWISFLLCSEQLFRTKCPSKKKELTGSFEKLTTLPKIILKLPGKYSRQLEIPNNIGSRQLEVPDIFFHFSILIWSIPMVLDLRPSKKKRDLRSCVSLFRILHEDFLGNTGDLVPVHRQLISALVTRREQKVIVYGIRYSTGC